MHHQLQYCCPHCLEKNPGFGPQRCQNCGLNMLSDREQAIREEKIAPLARQLDEQLLYLRGGKSQEVSLPYAYSLLAQLETLSGQSENFAFLDSLIESAKETLPPYTPHRKSPDHTLTLNIVILVLLALAPFMMGWLGANFMVIALMCLPVLGWAYLGIYAYRKKRE